jgi:glycosyltransferase involved in cell wall biosynthesis
MTVSMLRGTAGNQRREVEKLCRWLAQHLQPQLVVFTNMLIAGCTEHLKAALPVPVLVTLQGDDAFLEHLPEPYKSRALDQLRKLVDRVDGFLFHSQYYAEFMQDYLGIPAEKSFQVPLGIDVEGFVGSDAATDASSAGSEREASRPPVVGYLARLAPQKGFHLLVDAFIKLRKIEGMQDARLHVAGWLGKDHEEYAEREFAKLRDAGLEDAFSYAGVVDRHEKLDFLKQLDVFSVPTIYREPKGLFVLESLAAGVPVVLPEHGAFPEMLRQLGGGRLVAPNDSTALAEALGDVLSHTETRRQLGLEASRAVHQRCNSDMMARATWDVWRRFLSD